MSTRVLKRRTAQGTRASWASVAFIVEAILLLVFLVASLAVLTQLFLTSLNKSVESRSLDAATIAATSIAEHFAADPAGVEEGTKFGDLYVKCEVSDTPRRNGTLYEAHISVFDLNSGSLIYELDTSRYESEGVVWRPL